MILQDLINEAQSLWSDKLKVNIDMDVNIANIFCSPKQVPILCDWLFNQKGYHFLGLIIEKNLNEWSLNYSFFDGTGQIQVQTNSPVTNMKFQSVSTSVHAADWHEREAENLFGIFFEGHPRLGNFISHDDFQPRRIVNAQGAFIMPVGPIFSGESESIHFQLETIGEEVLRAFPRLFFKHRGIEKTIEGRTIDDSLLIAERFAGDTAFSNALAFSIAIENICHIDVPLRAKELRIFMAELERIRHHIGVIEGICNSTGLVVAASQVAILEEEMLRLTCRLCGHRYIFGLAIPGGLSVDLDDNNLLSTIKHIDTIIKRLDHIENLLKVTSSFLDRIEEVGRVTNIQAKNYELVGPVARGSCHCNDIRKIRPYSGYERFNFNVACEKEGDGYARLRVFFFEIRQSINIMKQIVSKLSGGSIFSQYTLIPGSTTSSIETPRGAVHNWIRVNEEGLLKRFKIITPSFTNWHGFHLAAENFAFQDFPIILATFGISVAENDR